MQACICDRNPWERFDVVRLTRGISAWLCGGHYKNDSVQICLLLYSLKEG